MATRTRSRRSAASAVPVYHGAFGVPQAERLLWRAGFGPRPGESAHVASLGLDGAVRYLTRPHSRRLVGPSPRVNGKPIDPINVWGHDVLWWMDRMIRSQAPGIERMTLVFHDWFATSVASVDETHMLAQNRMLRSLCLGTFPALLTAVTKDPAMLVWLNGIANEKGAPNENYGREMMELFTLGAGNGYTETDVRQMARSLTGWQSTWSQSTGMQIDFHFESSAHDDGIKRVFGHSGNYDWRDAVHLAVSHPDHPRYFVTKLWGYFIPTTPTAADVKHLSALYLGSGQQIRPVVEAILKHLALHDGPRMVKPPIVYLAGLLRAIGRYIDTDDWAWLSEMCGQRIFMPPNVSGWDATRWLDTATWRGRWIAVDTALTGRTINPDKAPDSIAQVAPGRMVANALAMVGSPQITPQTHAALVEFAGRGHTLGASASWKTTPFAAITHNALLMLILTSPDFHTS